MSKLILVCCLLVAQIHLHQSAKDAIRQLLPNTGHIATVAAWADRVS